MLLRFITRSLAPPRKEVTKLEGGEVLRDGGSRGRGIRTREGPRVCTPSDGP